MSKEIWKDVVGYEGYYKISNLGNVFSIRNNKQLRPGNNKQGYRLVVLCINGNNTTKRVHRLVAEAFIENIKNKKEVNHIDGNTANNIVNNLEWCTRSENMIHNFNKLGYKSSNYGKFGKDNHNSIEVNQYTLEGKYIKTWGSCREIERIIGYNNSNINKVCQGKQKTAYKFIWKYSNYGK